VRRALVQPVVPAGASPSRARHGATEGRFGLYHSAADWAAAGPAGITAQRRCQTTSETVVPIGSVLRGSHVRGALWQVRHNRFIKSEPEPFWTLATYSITSSACSRIACEISRPIALAFLRFMVSGNLVGACTGDRSAWPRDSVHIFSGFSYLVDGVMSIAQQRSIISRMNTGQPVTQLQRNDHFTVGVGNRARHGNDSTLRPRCEGGCAARAHPRKPTGSLAKGKSEARRPSQGRCRQAGSAGRCCRAYEARIDRSARRARAGCHVENAGKAPAIGSYR
jgi:hypothetical protein